MDRLTSKIVDTGSTWFPKENLSQSEIQEIQLKPILTQPIPVFFVIKRQGVLLLQGWMLIHPFLVPRSYRVIVTESA